MLEVYCSPRPVDKNHKKQKINAPNKYLTLPPPQTYIQ